MWPTIFSNGGSGEQRRIQLGSNGVTLLAWHPKCGEGAARVYACISQQPLGGIGSSQRSSGETACAKGYVANKRSSLVASNILTVWPGVCVALSSQSVA